MRFPLRRPASVARWTPERRPRYARRAAKRGFLSLIGFQYCQEGLLRDLDHAHLLHALLALGLLLQQFALAGDVAAITLGRHVLAHRRDRLAGNHPAADG